MIEEHTPVLVVGGSLVGLSAAAFLRRFGVPCVLVERHPGTHPHQRATGYYPRTLELLRSIGAEEPLRRAGADSGADTGRRIRIRMESLTGRVLDRFDLPPAADLGDLTPSPPAVTDQSIVETVLRQRAEALGADVRFGAELVDLDQDDTGVTAVVADRAGGGRRRLRAGHMIAADGGDSGLRDRLGIGTHGPGVLSHQINIYFRAAIPGPIDPRELVVCQIENERVRAFFGYDSTGVGMLICTYDPQRGESPADYTDDRCHALIRAAMGVPDLAIELVGRTPWTMSGVLADRFREGRVFLAGDAATVVPPVGGYGANTGIHAAHNLAWKLAQVHHGAAMPGILDTYESERRPVAAYVLKQALLQRAVRLGLAGPDQAAAVADELTVSLGYRYRSRLILDPPADDWPAQHPATLRGEPGTRAPHLWIRHRGARLSLLDLFGPGYTLLTGPRGDHWTTAAAGHRLPAYRIGVDVPAETSWTDAYACGPADAVLIRPDGFVAWRSTGAGPGALPDVLDQLRCRADAATLTGGRSA